MVLRYIPPSQRPFPPSGPHLMLCRRAQRSQRRAERPGDRSRSTSALGFARTGAGPFRRPLDSISRGNRMSDIAWKRRLVSSLVVLAAAVVPSVARAQQAVDSAYTAQIKQDLEDPRITTELV